MSERLAWLHVSDFHLRTGVDPFSQDVATQALLEDIPTRIETPLSFAVVTGDLAFSGKEAEYEQVSQVMARVASIADIPQHRFFFVPGNHDVDRTKEELAFEGALSGLSTQDHVDRLLARVDQLQPLIRRQAAFWQFVEAFTEGQERTATPSGLGYVAGVLEDSLRISIIALNSSWLCGRDDEKLEIAHW